MYVMQGKSVRSLCESSGQLTCRVVDRLIKIDKTVLIKFAAAAVNGVVPLNCAYASVPE